MILQDCTIINTRQRINDQVEGEFARTVTEREGNEYIIVQQKKITEKVLLEIIKDSKSDTR